MLYVKKGSRYVAAAVQEVCEAAAGYLAEPLMRGDVFSNPRAVRDYLRTRIAMCEREEFVVLYLDNRHRLIVSEALFLGTIDGASVHPREVVRRVIETGAAAVILAHNHPSGNAEPSNADEIITTRIRDALYLIDVRLLDHLIVTRHLTTSFAERGLL